MRAGSSTDTPSCEMTESLMTPTAHTVWHTATANGTRKYTSTWARSDRKIMRRSQPISASTW